MQTLDPKFYSRLTFSDDFVETMSFDPEKKELVITTDGGGVVTDSEIEFKQCRLFFYQWESLSIRKFHSATEKWEHLDYENFELFRDLLEVEISESKVMLCGFSRSSGWLEWVFKNLKIKIEYSI